MTNTDQDNLSGKKTDKWPLYVPGNNNNGRSTDGPKPTHDDANSALSHAERHNQRKDTTDPKALNAMDFGEHHPDGGWGWVVCGAATAVHLLCQGYHFAYGTLYIEITNHFKATPIEAVWVGSIGVSVSMLLPPFITTICRRKSPRLYAIVGGLIASLGCLFLAFSTQVAQLFISYCAVFSFGNGIALSTATIMLGRYFKRRREFAELVMIAGTGLGAALMAVLFKELISSLSWMHGLQCVTGLLVTSIIAGSLYRSASLYHPRRKVILHIRKQKKTRREREAEKPPYLDFSVLKMRSLQALMAASSIVALGIHVPFIVLSKTASDYGINSDLLQFLSLYLGMGFLVGTCTFGYLIIRKSDDCAISRRHLCQLAALACGVSSLLFTMSTGYKGHALYSWAYGIFCGGYQYSLKMYTYELVKAKMMERAWSFVCFSQFFSYLLGSPISMYLTIAYDTPEPAYVFSGAAMVIGGLVFCLLPVFEQHKSNFTSCEKTVSSSSNPQSESAALLDVDISDLLTIKPLNNSQYIVTPTKGNHNVTDGQKIQMQCFVQQRDRQKQIILSKITEEKEMIRLDFNEIGIVAQKTKISDILSNNKDTAEPNIPVIPKDQLFSDVPLENYHSNVSKPVKENQSRRNSEKKHSKKNSDAARVDLFDPPSQEKESTATVSYDSDLYINLCEAQV